jgi:hypothetical protein
MESLPTDGALPPLRLSLTDLIMLLKACGNGVCVLAPVDLDPSPSVPFDSFHWPLAREPRVPNRAQRVIVVGPARRPGKPSRMEVYLPRLPGPHASETTVERLIRAAETLVAAARTRPDPSDDGWEISLRDLLAQTLLARYSRVAGNLQTAPGL